MKSFLRQLGPAMRAVIVLTVVTGIVYPLAVTGAAQALFHAKANGSIIEVKGTAVGSRLIGQPFTAATYLHPRPSAAGTDGYDGTSSSGSNLGPTNPTLLATVADRVTAYRQENGLSARELVPVDAVTASASGLDPHISLANARLQAPRVAVARGVPVATVLAVIDAHVDGRPLGILGDPGVNVLGANLALDGTA